MKVGEGTVKVCKLTLLPCSISVHVRGRDAGNDATKKIPPENNRWLPFVGKRVSTTLNIKSLQRTYVRLCHSIDKVCILPSSDERVRFFYVPADSLYNIKRSRSTLPLTAHHIGYMAIHRIQQEDNTNSFSPSEEEDFGAFIERVLRRSRIQIQEIAAQFPQHLKTWNRFTYSHLVGESKRTPLFEELLPLYQALVIGGVHFSVAERNQFLALARLKVEHRSPGKGVTHPTEQQWRSLHAALAEFDQMPLFPPGDQGSARTTCTQSLPPLQEDRRHLLGRDDWIQEMRAYLHGSLPKKLVVIQATLGAGKFSALNFLRRSLEENGAYRLIFFTCPSPSSLTHEEQLDLFWRRLWRILVYTCRRCNRQEESGSSLLLMSQ